MMFSDFIKEYSVDDSVTWNEAVKKFEKYDVFYLNEYVSAFMQENEENGEPILIVYSKEDDYAINVVFRRDIQKVKVFEGHIDAQKYYDLISPYGYGGFIGDISDYDTLNNIYKEYCETKGYISEFIRFELFSEYSQHFDGEVETRTHNVIRDLNMPIDEIWMDFEHKVRKNIKRATQNGLEIKIDSGEDLDDFLSIYYGTMKRTNADKQFYFSKEFFQILNTMSENVAYFYVMYENRIISAELVIYGPVNGYSYLGGTDRDFFHLRPNDFLKYEIVKWAKEKGLNNFVLGGGYGKDDGIFQYKKSLAPNGVVNFYIGKKIYNQEIYDMLVQLKNKNSNGEKTNMSYFPAYRA